MLTLKSKKQKKLEEASFACIIPFKILSDPMITSSEKILYGIITGLTRASGICFASNRYFSTILDVNERHIRKLLEALKKHKLIETDYTDNKKKTRRTITIPWMKNIKFTE